MKGKLLCQYIFLVNPRKRINLISFYFSKTTMVNKMIEQITMILFLVK